MAIEMSSHLKFACFVIQMFNLHKLVAYPAERERRTFDAPPSESKHTHTQ